LGKTLTPQIKTCHNFKTSETVRGISINSSLKYTNSFLTFKLEGVYLENGSEFLSISRFAVKDTIDGEKGIVDYTPVRTCSVWNDISTNGKRLQFGIFSGYTNNLGSKAEINGPVYLMSNTQIKSLYRVSPRLSIIRGNLVLGAEIEYTSALYGVPDKYGVMVNTFHVDNFRLLFSTIYKF
jgi:hypothetical protein